MWKSVQIQADQRKKMDFVKDIDSKHKYDICQNFVVMKNSQT